MSSISERIEYLLKKNGVASREIRRRLSEICGISYQAVTQWFNGSTKNIESQHLAKIAKEYNASLEWLVSGTGSMEIEKETFPRPASDEDFAFIPFYNANGSCGNGYSNDHVEIKKTLAFHKDWLKANALTESKLSVITAKGDSMSPTITDGAILLINGGYGRVENGKVYAIVINDEVRIKRLFIGIGGDCRISSDNTNKTLYPDETISADTLSSLHIIGRVVWTGGML